MSAALKKLRITERQRAVWICIAMGQTRKEMTKTTGYTENAASSSARLLYQKSGAKCVADATRLAVRYGVIAVEVER